MKNECEVIKDLLPSYIAGVLSSETDDAIKEHITNCTTCREILKNMNNGEINKSSIQGEKEEIDYLKKHNTKMKTLKIILILIILILIAFPSIFIIKYNYNVNIMKLVSNNIEKIQEENNYTVNVTEHRIDYENKRVFTTTSKYYYKDNKYKIENHCGNASFDVKNKDTYYYGEIDTCTRTKIVEDIKTVYRESRNYVYVKKGTLLKDIKNEIEIFDINLGFFSNIIIKSGYQIRNDRYNGKECYVIKKGNNEGYSEFWIQKDSMMIIRRIQDLYNNSYTEKNYSISINSVKEKDLVIPDLEEYKIEESINNVDEEYIELYKNLI